MLRLCLHPDWQPLPTGVVHFVRDTVTLSRGHMHEPPLRSSTCRTLDLRDDEGEDAGLARPLIPWDDATVLPAVNPPPRRWSVGLFVLLALLVLVFARVLEVGHLAFVKRTTVTTAEPLSIGNGVQTVHAEYGTHLLPVLLPILPTPHPMDANDIIGSLIEEVREVKYGVHTWGATASSSTDLDLGTLYDRLDILLSELRSTRDQFTYVHRWLPQLISPRALEILIDAVQRQVAELDGGDSGKITMQAVRQVGKSLSLLRERNGNIRETLTQAGERCEDLIEQVGTLMEVVTTGLKPLADAEGYGWTLDTLDAARYATNDLMPGLRLIPPLLNRATGALAANDATLGGIIARLKELHKTGGYTEDVKIVGHEGWVIREERIRRNVVLDDGLLIELEACLEGPRGAARVLEERKGDVAWRYSLVRPPRPRDKRK